MISITPDLQDGPDLEGLAAQLEATGTYRVLRKLAPRPTITPPLGVKVRQGLFVDTETTGLDPARDEIIELAMAPFTYGLDGEIYAVGELFRGLREPSATWANRARSPFSRTFSTWASPQGGPAERGRVWPQADYDWRYAGEVDSEVRSEIEGPVRPGPGALEPDAFAIGVSPHGRAWT